MREAWRCHRLGPGVMLLPLLLLLLMTKAWTWACCCSVVQMMRPSPRRERRLLGLELGMPVVAVW